jgi:long-chain acyl-CoA synthetase
MTYAQAGAVRDALGAGLVSLGIAPGKDRMGLYSVNCRDWVLLDAAAHSQSVVSVPLYDTLGEDAVSYICAHAELACVGCSGEALPTLLHALPRCPTVRLVVVYGLAPGGVPYPPASGTTNARVVTIDELAAAGRQNLRRVEHRPPRPEDVATICYTSGTTGVPKGAVLSHANLVADAAGSFRILRAAPGDVHVSYLPLAHIYERVTVLGLTHCGAAVGFFSGDVQALLDDVLLLRPTIFCSVPRLWNRIHDRVLGQVRQGSAVARRLFEAAYGHKRAALARGDLSGGGIAGAFWDALVFSKVRAKLGGRVRLMTTGASPISGDVIDFMRVCFGATVVVRLK